MPGYVVVENIRNCIHHFGQVVAFKAYLEINDTNQTSKKGLRSELQSSGVSLTDTPHNGRKDAADKMMMVDMLAFAIDQPPPATIVLISGASPRGGSGSVRWGVANVCVCANLST